MRNLTKLQKRALLNILRKGGRLSSKYLRITEAELPEMQALMDAGLLDFTKIRLNFKPGHGYLLVLRSRLLRELTAEEKAEIAAVEL